MTVRRILVALVISIVFIRCGDDREFSKLPVVEFSTTEVTDTSATLRLDVVDKGTASYPTIGGIRVVWNAESFSWSESFEESDFLTNEINQDFYEVTLDSLQSATVYYVNTYHLVYEFTDGGDILTGLGDENFSFTTLPN